MTATHTTGQRFVGLVSKAVGALRGSTRPGLRVLLYHAVGTHVPHDIYGMSVTPRDFAAQMRWLREESGCSLAPLESGVAALADADRRTDVAVTFDDGFMDTLTEAAPVLVRYGIPFTVFVVGGFLERPPVRGQYLDVPALRELARVPGASIGAHGATHRPLTRLASDALDDELRQSRDVLQQSLGLPPSGLSYPHGAVNRHVTERARAAGFELGATSLAGINRAGVHPLNLRRTEILAGDDLGAFSRKVRGDYDWYQIRQRLSWPLPPE